MRTNYELKHCRDHADSEYVSHVGYSAKEPSLSVTNKQINSLDLKHTNTDHHNT